MTDNVFFTSFISDENTNVLANCTVDGIRSGEFEKLLIRVNDAVSSHMSSTLLIPSEGIGSLLDFSSFTVNEVRRSDLGIVCSIEIPSWFHSRLVSFSRPDNVADPANLTFRLKGLSGSRTQIIVDGYMIIFSLNEITSCEDAVHGLNKFPFSLLRKVNHFVIPLVQRGLYSGREEFSCRFDLMSANDLSARWCLGVSSPRQVFSSASLVSKTLNSSNGLFAFDLLVDLPDSTNSSNWRSFLSLIPKIEEIQQFNHARESIRILENAPESSSFETFLVSCKTMDFLLDSVVSKSQIYFNKLLKFAQSPTRIIVPINEISVFNEFMISRSFKCQAVKLVSMRGLNFLSTRASQWSMQFWNVVFDESDDVEAMIDLRDVLPIGFEKLMLSIHAFTGKHSKTRHEKVYFSYISYFIENEVYNVYKSARTARVFPSLQGILTCIDEAIMLITSNFLAELRPDLIIRFKDLVSNIVMEMNLKRDLIVSEFRL